MTPTQVLSCEYLKIFKNSVFIERLQWLVLQVLYKKAVPKILQTLLEPVVTGVFFNQDACLELATLSK